ncbi:MAG TPA: aspartate ammonia-lyase [Candidatus Hydrogenedentes bacterium]|nr:aspartate ammonia-lyase [Candidatus Hydrogenedentota bacterium]HOS01444.1 aspartate ammonia-lyase [Candidatus Hydrogenedentota bacterium]
MSKGFRTEHDFLGDMAVPEDALYGIHTVRAQENFGVAGRPVPPALVRAYGMVKLACAVTNQTLGAWSDDKEKAAAINRACREMADGLLTDHVVVDWLQGGAGTSTNLNVNEVIANRAQEILGLPRGSYARVSAINDINRHQSTNDTFPTALRLAAIWLIKELEQQLVLLQEAFQAKEKEFAHVVKVGRTQLQDAVLTTLGREMGAYAEAINRDRWRVYKCEERLRVVNLGGTAIGTGLAAPRQYIFQVVDTLRGLTGIGFARAENLVDATQNADVFVEVSGILKACAVSLLKISTDLRLMSSGPESGLGEIRLPERQAGSSIMPGKVNPVIPETVSQAAMLVMGHDVVIAQACAAGNLELNAFLPLVAGCLLESCEFLTRACDRLRRFCVEDIEADEARCRAHVEASTAVATALMPALGYDRAAIVAKRAAETRRTVRDIVLQDGLLDEKTFDELITPEAVCRLGMPNP